MLITGTNKAQIERLRVASNERFGEGQWTPEVDSFLGLRCQRCHLTGVFKIDVEMKIEALVESLDLKGLTPVTVPWNAELDTVHVRPESSQTQGKERHLSIIKDNFATICGTCLYMSITCRPDIATICSRYCRGMHGPTYHHILLAYYMIRYLWGTKSHGLHYYRDNSPIWDSVRTMEQHYPEMKHPSEDPVIAFSDADFADKWDERLRSTSGFVIYVFGNLVSWSCRQKLSAKSTMAAQCRNLIN